MLHFFWSSSCFLSPDALTGQFLAVTSSFIGYIFFCSCQWEVNIGIRFFIFHNLIEDKSWPVLYSISMILDFFTMLEDINIWISISYFSSQTHDWMGSSMFYLTLFCSNLFFPSSNLYGIIQRNFFLICFPATSHLRHNLFLF